MNERGNIYEMFIPEGREAPRTRAARDARVEQLATVAPDAVMKINTQNENTQTQSGVSVSSRFSLEECRRYADHLKQRRANRIQVDEDGWLFQPHTNARTLIYDKAISTRMIGKIVKKYAEYAGLGEMSPHDLRRTAITRALDMGESIREVQMMSGHKDIRSLMKYDHGRENIEKNPINRLHYDD